MRPRELIATARLLATSGRSKPSQVNLRAVITACYALFHALATNGADLLVGGRNSATSRDAWRHIYRALDHGNARDACQSGRIVSRFPKAIEVFANLFATMQIKRNEADYDFATRCTRSEVLQDIATLEAVIAAFHGAAKIGEAGLLGLRAPQDPRLRFSPQVVGPPAVRYASGIPALNEIPAP